jgi:glyoxylase-like metal-dependent hydrolase (beta-lactamase superfamily II)
MQNVIIHQIPTGPFHVFTYLVACPGTKEAVLIDPAGEEEKLAARIQAEGLKIKYILNTHGHADHVLGNRNLKMSLSAPVCMHEEDDRFFTQGEGRERAEKELGLPPPGPADRRLKDRDRLRVGNFDIEVVHTPGHTPGSVCYLVQGNLFTGDTLFVGSAGRTDLSGGSLDRLLESIEKRLLPLPEETVVWPGHDYGDTPSSTMGREKEENVYITDFLV